MGEINYGEMTVFLCERGAKSMVICRDLWRMGYEVSDLAGGMSETAKRIEDSSLGMPPNQRGEKQATARGAWWTCTINEWKEKFHENFIRIRYPRFCVLLPQTVRHL